MNTKKGQRKQMRRRSPCHKLFALWIFATDLFLLEDFAETWLARFRPHFHFSVYPDRLKTWGTSERKLPRIEISSSVRICEKRKSEDVCVIENYRCKWIRRKKMVCATRVWLCGDARNVRHETQRANNASATWNQVPKNSDTRKSFSFLVTPLLSFL